MILLQNHRPFLPAKVDISLLLKSQDDEETAQRTTTTTTVAAYPPTAASGPVVTSTSLAAAPTLVPRSSGGELAGNPLAPISSSRIGTKRLQPAHTAESPAKKQSKWSLDEDALIIELRGSGMKWEDISKRLPGRSAISCRLHYQNYLERRSEWDEDKKNKLARLYERFKADMWSKVAEEMAIPWRAAEAMHWQLGEQEMARRAGVVPFSLSSSAIDPPAPRTRRASTSLARTRRESVSRSFASQLPPQGQPSGPPQLPSLEELTAGVPAFAPNPQSMQSRDAYRVDRPPEYSAPPGSHIFPGFNLPPRTLP